MVNRLARIGLAALLTTALAGHGPAWAQKDRKDRDKQGEEEEDELGDDTDPCKGVEPACGETEEDENEGGGGKSKSKSSKNGDGDELAAGEGDGDGEGDGKGGGDGEGEGEGDGKGSGGGSDEGEGSATASADADATIEAAPMGNNLGEGKFAINAAFKVGLSDGATGDPISIEPDIWYGINQKLTAGLVTSGQAITGFWGGAGNGVCVGDACADKVFDNVGAEALYALKSDPSLVFALDVGFHAVAIDGTVLAAKVGGKGIWRSGNISVGFSPNIFIGVTKRDVNKENFNLPVDLSFMMSPKLSLGVQTGVSDTFEGAGDNYNVPVALGAYLMISEKLSASAAFSLDRVVSGGDGNGIKARTVSFVLGYLM
jgi:hypothetical protein